MGKDGKGQHGPTIHELADLGRVSFPRAAFFSSVKWERTEVLSGCGYRGLWEPGWKEEHEDVLALKELSGQGAHRARTSWHRTVCPVLPLRPSRGGQAPRAGGDQWRGQAWRWRLRRQRKQQGHCRCVPGRGIISCQHSSAGEGQPVSRQSLTEHVWRLGSEPGVRALFRDLGQKGHYCLRVLFYF